MPGRDCPEQMTLHGRYLPCNVMASEPGFPDVSECVGTTVLVSPRDLHTFHRNARRGDLDAIAGSLKANGQFKPIVVNVGTHTGRRNEVLAGNHTLMAFRQLAEQDPFDLYWTAIKVHVVDVDEDMATRIVLVDNRSFEQGDFDAEALLALLDDVGVEGTGYTETDLDDLEDAIAKAAGGSDRELGDPEQPSLPPVPAPVISFTVLFDDETQQDAWFEFVKWLKDRYPDLETVAERLTAHLTETAGARV